MTGVEAIKRYAERKKEEFEASDVILPLATGEKKQGDNICQRF